MRGGSFFPKKLSPRKSKLIIIGGNVVSSFALKLIAAISMFIDHMGLLLFPQYRIFRIIGRLAFPIYAYCIAEGFRYTRNRRLYFLRIFLLGLICQAVYTIADRKLYIGILLVFSYSIILMGCLDSLKQALRGNTSAVNRAITRLLGRDTPLNSKIDKWISGGILTALTFLAFVLCMNIDVDYGFFGILLPVFTSFFNDRPRRLAMFASSLLALSIDMISGGFIVQFWSLLSVPLLATYNGRPGKYRMKYFFYIFYPAHLVLLYAIQQLVG